MKFISLFLILFAIIVIILGIIKVHTLPGVIAKQRNHPQAEAIEITAYLGLLVFPLWMAALIWAYIKPVLKPVVIESATDTGIEQNETKEDET
jgi:uncharacterized membrane protein YidH (DUF202 family)